MPKVIETLLTSVGIPAEDVQKIVALTEEEEKTYDVKPLAEKVKTNYETQLKNSPEFFNELTIEKLPPSVKKTLESGQYARATNEAKSKIAKALGFSADEIKDLETDDFKALDFYIPAIAEKYIKSKAGDKQLQQDLIAERKKNEEFEKKYGGDYEKEVETKHQTAAEQRVTAAIFQANLVGELSSIQGLKIPASDIAATANQILQGKYGFAKVGDYGIELRQKSNPEMKVLKTGSSQELTLKEALAEIATERGWIEKEKEGGSGSGVVTVTPTHGQLQMVAVAPHLQEKISKKIAAEK